MRTLQTPERWYSWLQLLGAFKILVLYLLFHLALYAVGITLFPAHSDADEYSDLTPY